MELKELIEKIVDQSDRVKADNRLSIVETIWADIEDWPAWYYELFSWERKYDFSGKRPTSLQKLNISTLKKATRSKVEEYAPELKSKRGKVVDVDDASLAIAERVTYWEEWYWDLDDSWAIAGDAEENAAYEDAYLSSYGDGMDERYHGT